MANPTPPSSTEPQRWAGPERRRFDRTPPPAPRVIGRARLKPECVRHMHGLLAGEWYPVIERPGGLIGRPVEGYIWLDYRGRPLSVWAAFFELAQEPIP
jgi:hypothetical protein